jgi:CHAT domain-containing protein
VVASLWKVDDQTAAALMQLFYYKLWNEGKSPATALREAQLALYRHPDQIGKLAGLRGPDFEMVVRAVEQPVPTPTHADVRDWAAFVLSGPGR